MEAQGTSCDGFAGREPLLLISRLHRSSHCLFIASNWPLNEYSEWVSCMSYFAIINLRTVLRLISILASRAYWSISIVCGGGNFTAIKHMCERLKPGLFSSSSGLGTRLNWYFCETTWWNRNCMQHSRFHVNTAKKLSIHNELAIIEMVLNDPSVNLHELRHSHNYSALQLYTPTW